MPQDTKKVIHADINLLPQGLKPKKYALTLSKNLKKVLIIGFCLFAILATVSLATIFVLSARMKSSVAKQDDLKSEIKNLEQSEQKLVLVKDRLGKIESILKGESASDEITTLIETSQKIPEGVSFKKANLSKSSADVTVSTANSFYLARFLAVLIGSGSYRRIELLSFSYDPKVKLYNIEFGLSE